MLNEWSLIFGIKWHVGRNIRPIEVEHKRLLVDIAFTSLRLWTVASRQAILVASIDTHLRHLSHESKYYFICLRYCCCPFYDTCRRNPHTVGACEMWIFRATSDKWPVASFRNLNNIEIYSNIIYEDLCKCQKRGKKNPQSIVRDGGLAVAVHCEAYEFHLYWFRMGLWMRTEYRSVSE